ncbi:MAG TPA: 3-oxoacyl-ACP reductase family protein [Candidatus Acidoferrales bacterium]|nr:3-oxoacyl-ACP reductase family protein [Candidatus Acidoferrales bacterium]
MNRLKDQVAIITGASRGIGRSIAEVFANEGARVVINYNSEDAKASEVAKGIEKEGGQAISIKSNVSNSQDVKRLVNTTLEKFGRIDILVNNAGVMFPEDFLAASEEVWDKTIDINLKGAYLCSKEVAPIMIKQKKGKIINISSNSGLYHPSSMRYVEYVASKAGMNGMTKALALRLGPYITVNAICPGYIKTEMVAHNDPATEKMLLDETALKRFGRPDEVASAAVYLASNEADFVTGELLIVAGGRGMH